MTDLTVTWPASQHAIKITYVLQYRAVGSSAWINATPAPILDTTFTLSGLAAAATYEFRQIASNAPVWREVSLPTRITTPPIQAPIPPAPPSGLTVTP